MDTCCVELRTTVPLECAHQWPSRRPCRRGGWKKGPVDALMLYWYIWRYSFPELRFLLLPTKAATSTTGLSSWYPLDFACVVHDRYYYHYIYEAGPRLPLAKRFSGTIFKIGNSSPRALRTCIVYSQVFILDEETQAWSSKSSAVTEVDWLHLQLHYVTLKGNAYCSK